MMKRIRAATLAVAALSYLSAALPARAETTGSSAPQGAARVSRSAPADEYFGPLKLSILGIRNTLADATARLDRGNVDPDRAVKHLALVERSVRDWEAKYPHDSWLPGTVSALHRAYAKVASEDGTVRAVEVAAWLLDTYGRSHEAQRLREELTVDDVVADSGG